MSKKIGIILNGATGRICSTQHLANSLVPICSEGGLKLSDETILPEIILVGRNAKKLEKIVQANNLQKWSTDIETVLADSRYHILFDGSATAARQQVLKLALDAGKHIYSEKPVALSVDEGLQILELAAQKGLKHGAVEDKMYAPGFLKMASLANEGFFGTIVGFKLDFGWWVFDGITAPSNRASWNYQKKHGGGIFFDMFPHWRYVIEEIIGPIKSIVAAGWTAQKIRADEGGGSYGVDVEDSGSVIVELQDNVFGTISSSWAQRVRGDDIVRFQIDGTLGSAVSGIRNCCVQSASKTPNITGFNFSADSEKITTPIDYDEGWVEVPSCKKYVNPYRVGWEQFLAHVVTGSPMKSDFIAGVRDVQLSQACIESANTGSWVSIEPLSSTVTTNVYTK